MEDLCEFFLDCFVVVSIGAGGFFGENRTFLYLTDKELMGAEIYLFEHLAAEKCVGVFGDIVKVVGTTLFGLKTVEFIDITTALHTEVLYGFKGQGFG